MTEEKKVRNKMLSVEDCPSGGVKRFLRCEIVGTILQNKLRQHDHGQPIFIFTKALSNIIRGLFEA